MKKKIWILIVSLVLCLCMTVSAFAEDRPDFSEKYNRVMDEAGLLTDSQRVALTEKIDEVRSRQRMDIVILTVSTLNGSTPSAYADDVFDDCGFGYGENRDGLLLLISTEDNDWYISTHGYGIIAFTNAGIQFIGKQMKEDLSDGNFNAAFESFVGLCDDFITQARAGSPYDTHNLPQEPLSLIWIPISIVLGIFLALAVVRGMKAKLKTVRFQAAAGSYMKAGSLNVTESRDLFLYHTVSRTAKPKNDSSGGSSTHTSSSGSTHGGGGGKF